MSFSLLPNRVVQTSQVPEYRLKWRQKTLVIRHSNGDEQGTVLTFGDAEHVANCLSRSRIKRVKLDVELATEDLVFWADAGKRAGKPVYLSLPAAPDLPPKCKPIQWYVKRFLDPLVAALILMVLSPLLLVLAYLTQQGQPDQSILRSEWQIGARGKLFEAYYFRVQGQDGRILPQFHWINRYHLDRLPKFWNVVQGHMTLVGACPRTAADAAGVDMQFRDRLNALPGITGAWHLRSKLALMDLNVLRQLDLEYFWNWSLWRDLQVIFLAAPKAIRENI
jgi:lipopolysaccharide/colanic/teichoic acid biosynthesis glycosyltransferase